jgi:hypothetical protein
VKQHAVEDAAFLAHRNRLGDELAAAGGEIVEIMGVIALFGFLNRWNDSMGTALEDLPMTAADRHLSHTGWQTGKHR